MRPMISSHTAGTKPGEARVTSTPAAEAATTSTVRISTALRTKATRPGSAWNSAAGPGTARSATMTRTPRAASISASPSSDWPVRFSRTSPSAASADCARSP